MADDLTFETGGALSGAEANATISVPTDVSQVEVGSSAVLESQGAIAINARGQGSLDEEIQTDTFGIGTLSAGTSTATMNAVNTILIDSSAALTAYGDLDIAAGTDGYPDYDQYFVTARFDGYAGSLVPISDVNANAYLTQTNTITIATHAVLKTAQQANLTAQDIASGDMIAYAVGVKLGERPFERHPGCAGWRRRGGAWRQLEQPDLCHHHQQRDGRNRHQQPPDADPEQQPQFQLQRPHVGRGDRDGQFVAQHHVPRSAPRRR